MTEHNLSPDKTAAIERFKRLSEVYPVDYLPEMFRLLEETMSRFSRAGEQFLAPQLELARTLEEKCRFLLSQYPMLKPADQAEVVGAVRYFILNVDEEPDYEPLSGLDDDVFIINRVLTKLGFLDDVI